MNTVRYESGNATVSPPSARITTSSDDFATRAWQRGTVAVSRDALLMSARGKVSRLTALPYGWDGHRAHPVGSLPAMVMNGLLGELVADDGATPQVAPMSDGGLQVEWLVSGDFVRIDVPVSGEVFVLAEDAAGNVFADGEFDWREPDRHVIDQARQFLNKISHNVEIRLASA